MEAIAVNFSGLDGFGWIVVTDLLPNGQIKDRLESFPWGTLRSISFPAAKNWKETWFRTKEEIKRCAGDMYFDVLHVHHLGHWPLTFPLKQNLTLLQLQVTPLQKRTTKQFRMLNCLNNI